MSDDARICPQDGGVCWEPNCDVSYCRGVADGMNMIRRHICEEWAMEGIGCANCNPIAVALRKEGIGVPE